MPRKTSAAEIGRRLKRPASMRPRPDAAENRDDSDQGEARVHLASMRPRPDAAENVRMRRRLRAALVAASMRPRPDAAENAGSASGGSCRG